MTSWLLHSSLCRGRQTDRQIDRRHRISVKSSDCWTVEKTEIHLVTICGLGFDRLFAYISVHQTWKLELTSIGSCRSWKKIVKSLDDGKVQILSVFLFCFVETSKRDPKPQIAIQNVKVRFKMSKGDPKCPIWAETSKYELKSQSASQNIKVTAKTPKWQLKHWYAS